MSTNTLWIHELFSQNHLSHIRLMESFSPKWFALKKGVAMYNPRQATCAENLEFKVYVLGVMYSKIGELNAK